MFESRDKRCIIFRFQVRQLVSFSQSEEIWADKSFGERPTSL